MAPTPRGRPTPESFRFAKRLAEQQKENKVEDQRRRLKRRQEARSAGLNQSSLSTEAPEQCPSCGGALNPTRANCGCS